MEKVDKQFSEKVTWLCFVFSILVIYIHANNLAYYGLANATDAIPYKVVHLIAGCVGGMAVPFFFAISGYWLFRYDIRERASYKILFGKLKKRMRTLVIPYLLWNMFGFAFYAVVTRIPFVSNMMNSGETAEFSMKSIFHGVFLHSNYFTFWYMQDLIVLCALAPLLMLILRNCYLSLAVVAALTFGTIVHLDLAIVSCSSLFFFMCGAMMATYFRKYIESMEIKIGFVAGGILLCCIAIRFFTDSFISETCLMVSPICLLFAANLIRNYKVTWFKEQSFFIYAVHVIPVTAIGHILAKINAGGYWCVMSYLIAPIITLALIYVLARILYSFTPKFYSLITGGRTVRN